VTRPLTFTKAQVARAVAAVEAGGKVVTGVDFPPEGGFRVLTADGLRPVDAERKGGDGWEDFMSDAA
jgi:hypothetical protein